MTHKKRDKKRRLDKLGTGTTTPPDPALAKLSDEELLREYQRELSGEAERERERERARSSDPLFAYLHDLSDEELLAEHAAAQSALAAERERRRPKTEPIPTPRTTVVAEPPLEPHAIDLQQEIKPEQKPKSPPAGGHVSFALEGCPCFQCAEHRRRARQAENDWTQAQKAECEPMSDGSVVQFAPNATPELRAALRGRTE